MTQAGNEGSDAPVFAGMEGACDCHIHVFGPEARYPFAPGRIYTPGAASPEAYLALRTRLGLSRVVLVQPSVYGTDNRCHLDAIGEIPGACGVAVISGLESEAEIARLNDAGFRGARLNLKQGIGAEPIGETLARMGARLARFGWHLQINASAEAIAGAEAVLREADAAIMFDHYAGLSPWLGTDQPGFDSVVRLLKGGRCWMKLSAPYIREEDGRGKDGRADGSRRAAQLVRTLVREAPGQLVWGSNWPHPGFEPPTTDEAAPIAPFRAIDDEAMARLFLHWVGDGAAARRILTDNAAAFYGF